MSEAWTSGTVSGGNPCGSVPTRSTPCCARSNRFAATIETTTAIRTLGTFGSTRWSTNMTTSPSTPIASAAVTVSPSATPLTNALASAMNPSASVENPNSLGSWPTRIVMASPFMYPIMVGLDRRSATHPSRASAAEQHDRSDHQRQHGCQCDRAGGIALGSHQREDRCGDHRPERRVGPKHEYPGRAEHRVADQAQNRRVQPGDRRKPRELGICHSLRYEQRGQYQPGNDVLGQPRHLVGGEHAEPGDRRPLGMCSGALHPGRQPRTIPLECLRDLLVFSGGEDTAGPRPSTEVTPRPVLLPSVSRIRPE